MGRYRKVICEGIIKNPLSPLRDSLRARSFGIRNMTKHTLLTELSFN